MQRRALAESTAELYVELRAMTKDFETEEFRASVGFVRRPGAGRRLPSKLGVGGRHRGVAHQRRQHDSSRVPGRPQRSRVAAWDHHNGIGDRLTLRARCRYSRWLRWHARRSH